MTKTEAADIIGNEVRVFAHRTGRTIDRTLVEERMSEAKHLGGLFPAAAAAAPSWRTVLKAAQR